MKGIVLSLGVLLIIFFGAWGIKANTPIDRPENSETDVVMPWYLSSYSSPAIEEEWMIDPTIPDNYVPVPGEDELYMVVDTSGQIIGYKHRIKQADGSWMWEDINPDIPNNYELVEGSENLYKVTDENGNVSYYLYVRNDDNSFAFVACDEFGVPYYDGEDAEVIASNFKNFDGNIYTVYNENGVAEGYAERVKNDDGTFTWNYVETPTIREYAESHQPENQQGTGNQGGQLPDLPELTTEELPDQQKIVLEGKKNDGEQKIDNGDGTYTVTNTTMSTSTENGYTVQYQTVVTNTYDRDGNLLFTRSDGPTEISRERTSSAETPDPSLVKDTLDEEYQRVSSTVSYNTELANQVLTLLNAERTAQGLGTLTMDTSSESYKLACLRAGDMATYNYSSSNSPMYGTLNDMVSKYGCTTANASENVWQAGNKSAEDIHSRLQAYEGSRNVRMSDSYTEVGIAIVSKNGQLYIAEVYLK